MKAILLPTTDIGPTVLPDEFRRKVVNTIVRNVKASPMGWMIDAAGLKSKLSSGLEGVCSGHTLDLQIVRDLATNEASNETDLYMVNVRIAEDLKAMGMKTSEPASPLSQPEKEQAREKALAARAALRADAGGSSHAQEGGHVQIGELLVQYGLITHDQLWQALRAQRIYGGRLGTNLVELGMIRADELATFLGMQMKVPAISPAELDNISESAMEAMEHELRKKYKAVPISLEGNVLKVAMVDPSDLNAIDAIQFATGYKVTAYVAPETAIARALSKCG